MIGTIGTIWGIGFVAFAFLFDRWKDFLKELYPSAESPTSRSVFSLFLLTTVCSFVSIVVSLAVFEANSHELLPLAWIGFLLATTAFLSLTVFVYRAAMHEVL